MGNIISVLHILCVCRLRHTHCTSGFLHGSPAEEDSVRINFRLVMLLWLPVLFAFILDFTLAAQILALAAAV